jgi:Family of unknown function (DUF5675)
MKIQVIRQKFDDVCTEGEMFIDGEHECYTLEPVTRPADAEKIFGKTAIPYGTYNVSITFSNHFQRSLPLLADVPNFEGVRIHPGNTAADTEGCCLVGETPGRDAIGQSVSAFNKLFPKIEAAIGRGEDVTITYSMA